MNNTAKYFILSIGYLFCEQSLATNYYSMTATPDLTIGVMPTTIWSETACNSTSMPAATTPFAVSGDVFTICSLFPGSIGTVTVTDGPDAIPANVSSVILSSGVTLNMVGNITTTATPLTFTISNGATLNLGAASNITPTGVLTLINNGTLNLGANTLTMPAGSVLTNNGTFNAGTSSVVFNGAGTVNGSASTTVFNNLTVNGGIVALLAPNTTFAAFAGTGSTYVPIKASVDLHFSKQLSLSSEEIKVK